MNLGGKGSTHKADWLTVVGAAEGLRCIVYDVVLIAELAYPFSISKLTSRVTRRSIRSRINGDLFA